MTAKIKRREFITLLGGAATTFPRSRNRAIRAPSILPAILEPFRRQLGIAQRRPHGTRAASDMEYI